MHLQAGEKRQFLAEILIINIVVIVFHKFLICKLHIVIAVYHVKAVEIEKLFQGIENLGMRISYDFESRTFPELGREIGRASCRERV